MGCKASTTQDVTHLGEGIGILISQIDSYKFLTILRNYLYFMVYL